MNSICKLRAKWLFRIPQACKIKHIFNKHKKKNTILKTKQTTTKNKTTTKTLKAFLSRQQELPDNKCTHIKSII